MANSEILNAASLLIIVAGVWNLKCCCLNYFWRWTTIYIQLIQSSKCMRHKKHTIVDTFIIYKLKQHMVDIKKQQQLLESITILCVFNYYITCGKPRAEKKKGNMLPCLEVLGEPMPHVKVSYVYSISSCVRWLFLFHLSSLVTFSFRGKHSEIYLSFICRYSFPIFHLGEMWEFCDNVDSYLLCLSWEVVKGRCSSWC